MKISWCQSTLSAYLPATRRWCIWCYSFKIDPKSADVAKFFLLFQKENFAYKTILLHHKAALSTFCGRNTCRTANILKLSNKNCYFKKAIGIAKQNSTTYYNFTKCSPIHMRSENSSKLVFFKPSHHITPQCSLKDTNNHVAGYGTQS